MTRAERTLPLLFAFLAVFLITSAPTRTYGQAEINLHQWSSLSLFNGLPSNSVTAITQTNDGVMWFGTYGGLAKLDASGIRKVSLGEHDGETINFLVPAGDVLVIATSSSVLYLSGGKLIEAFLPNAGTIRFVSADGPGVLVVTPTGVLRAEPPATRFVQSSKVRDRANELTAAVRSEQGSLIIATNGGGIVDDSAQEELIGPRPDLPKVLERDPSGGVYIGADTGNRTGGLYVLHDDKVEQIGGSTIGTVTSVAAGRGKKEAWAGSESGGLFHIEDDVPSENFTFGSTGGGLRSNRIYSVFVDREGTVWVGGDRGVSRFDPGSPHNENLSSDKRSNFIRLLYRDNDGKIYVGTNRGLFSRYPEGWRSESGFADETVYAISQDAEGSLLVGTRTKLADSGGSKLIEGDVRGAVAIDGRVYALVFGKGLVTLNDDKEEELVFRHEELISSWTDGKRFLIGTGKGEVLEFRDGEVVPVRGFDALRDTPVWKIHMIKALKNGGPERTVLATQSGVFIEDSGKVERFLEGVAVRDCYVNGADIWAVTIDNGLIHLRKDDRFGLLRSDITTEQGLPSLSAFSMLPLEDGRLLIATTQGVSYYTPNTVKPYIQPVRLLSQRLHSPEEMRKGIILEYPQNSLVLEAGGMSSRTIPEKFLYAFFLKDKKGKVVKRQVSGEPQFLMDDLKAGKYSVEAYAFNQDLVPSDPLTFSFSVEAAPFPWTSTALGALLLVALIALAWAIIERKRISSVNRKLTAARLDLANEAERERRRIARDLHDQTLADLRHLMLRSDSVSGEKSEFRKEIEDISEEIRRICEDLSPSVLENVGLLAALEFLLSGSGLKTKFEIVEGSADEPTFASPVQMQVFRIAQEVISNIRRHADAENIAMSVSIDHEKGFTLEIKDDGKIPFDPDEHMKEGRGLSNIKSRASLIESEVIWTSGEEPPRNTFTLFRLETIGD